MIYKLSFESSEQWEAIKEPLLIDNPTISIALERHLSYPAVIDPETGDTITEAGFYDEFAVDIYTDVLLPVLDEFIMTPKLNYLHRFAGISNYDIVAV